MTALSWLTQRPVAHRGLHDIAAGIVENTESAVQAALDGNYAIEVDLQLTGDGEAVVFHDETLDRLMQAQGRVFAHTSSELKTMAFQTGQDRIQTLDELLEQVAGKATLVLEIKSQRNNIGPLERRVAEVLRNYRGPAAVMSFDPGSVEIIRHIAPAITRGLVSERFDRTDEWAHLSSGERLRRRHLLTAWQCRPHFINYDINALPAFAPQLARLFGLPLLTWTVRTEQHRATAQRWADAMVFEGFRA